MRVSFAGLLGEGVSAKDLILFTIRELSVRVVTPSSSTGLLSMRCRWNPAHAL